MEFNGEVVGVEVREHNGSWKWSYFLNGQYHQCMDRGLSTEELARVEGEADALRVIEILKNRAG
ncbi:hypothetical protein [Bordetella bronchiseptica]|uniref:hypothetical protein n=1 Tax=Bordetella bronchiseptica TaxID=518 RepID=UPI00045A5FA3|nr:hypothetical protein [Bordetella bronchiseptica]KAK74773.1 hypothetical protein L530_3455 [Bordetella bronchiseptica MO211]